jgi:hypothetical protein
MNGALKAMIMFMLNKRYIGGKHFPEDKLVNSRTKWLQKEELKEFEKEYKELINTQFILKTKKRTGKGYDWHVSLNPRKLKEMYELIK